MTLPASSPSPPQTILLPPGLDVSDFGIAAETPLLHISGTSCCFLFLNTPTSSLLEWCLLILKNLLVDIISLARTFPALEPGYILLLVEIWYLLFPLWKSSWYLCFLVCKCACFCWCNSVTQHTGQTKMSKFGAEKCLLHDHARKLVAHVLKIFQTPQTKITKHF